MVKSLLEVRIEELLEDFSLEEILEMCDITPLHALTVLYEGGHIELPEWTERKYLENEDDDWNNPSVNPDDYRSEC